MSLSYLRVKGGNTLSQGEHWVCRRFLCEQRPYFRVLLGARALRWPHCAVTDTKREDFPWQAHCPQVVCSIAISPDLGRAPAPFEWCWSFSCLRTTVLLYPEATGWTKPPSHSHTREAAHSHKIIAVWFLWPFAALQLVLAVVSSHIVVCEQTYLSAIPCMFRVHPRSQ